MFPARLPVLSQSLIRTISSPAGQKTRWSPLTELLLFMSRANNGALSVDHSGQFTPAFSHCSRPGLYQLQPQGTRGGGAIRSYIVPVAHGWFMRALLLRVTTSSKAWFLIHDCHNSCIIILRLKWFDFGFWAKLINPAGPYMSWNIMEFICEWEALLRLHSFLFFFF